jgi:acyl carrier protein
MSVTRNEVSSDIRALIVERLQLRVSPSEIQDGQALFVEGLGLDSIEALEIAVGLEERFGIVVEDTEDVKRYFYSVNTLTDYVLLEMEQAARSASGENMR